MLNIALVKRLTAYLLLEQMRQRRIIDIWSLGDWEYSGGMHREMLPDHNYIFLNVNPGTASRDYLVNQNYNRTYRGYVDVLVSAHTMMDCYWGSELVTECLDNQVIDPKKQDRAAPDDALGVASGTVRLYDDSFSGQAMQVGSRFELARKFYFLYDRSWRDAS